MKKFYCMNNIGKAKYTVNYHNGVEIHKDGSPFYSIAIFRNKKKLANFKKKLILEGYTES